MRHYTEALLQFEIMSDLYDAVISDKGRAVATTDPECLAAEAEREVRRRCRLFVFV